MSNTGIASAEYGGFWKRVGAGLIDGIILNIIQKAVELVVTPLFGFENLATIPEIAPGTPEQAAAFQVMAANWGLFLAYFLVLMIGPVLYEVGMTASSWQATVGKRALGLIVVDKAGNRLTVGRAFGRYLAKIPSAMILGIGYLMVGWTDRKRGLHDMIAGTLVVKKDSLALANVF